MRHIRNGWRADPMIRISLPYLATVFSSLEVVDRIDGKDAVVDTWLILFDAQQQIEALFNQSVYSAGLRSSRQFADAFVGAINKHTSVDDPAQELGAHRAWEIKHYRDQLKTALLAELGAMPAYFVTQKEGYDTITLLEFGHVLFPSSLRAKVPEAIFDATEVGKALAFELATASGFYIFRVLEAVLRRYHAEMTGGKAPPKVRTIGVYLKSMRSAGYGNPKVLAALDQIRDLHRNPLIHPETVINMDQAISLLGIVRSAVAEMLNELPDVPLTTGNTP